MKLIFVLFNNCFSGAQHQILRLGLFARQQASQHECLEGTRGGGGMDSWAGRFFLQVRGERAMLTHWCLRQIIEMFASRVSLPSDSGFCALCFVRDSCPR